MDGSNITGGGSSAVNYQTYEDLQTQQATKNLEVKNQDSMDSIAPTRSLGSNYVDTYVSPPGKVALPVPDPKFSNISSQNIQDSFKSGQNVLRDSRADMEQQFADTIQGNTDFYQNINAQLNGLTDAQLQEIAYQPGMSSDDIKEQILYAAMHPDAKVPENVRALSNQIYGSALTASQQTQGADWTPMNAAWLQDVGIEFAVQGYFNEAAGEIPGLTTEEKNQMRFALENPDAVDSLPPKLQAIFKQIMGKVMTQAQTNLGVPANWTFSPPKMNLPSNLSNSFDLKFEIETQSLVNEGKLSATDAAKLCTLHYNPAAKLPGADGLKAKLAEIEGNVLNSLQPIYGFPAGYRPTPNPVDRDNTANVAYQSAFYKNMDNYSPPLSQEAKDAIRASQGSSAPALPPGLQKIADKIKQMSIAQVSETFGLPADWSPQVRPIVDLNQVDRSNPLFNSLLGFVKEIQEIGQKTVTSLPSGEIKNVYMVFLSLLGATLAKLAETLTVCQVCQANLSKTLSQMKLDTELNKIKKQQDAMKDMQKTQEKGGVGGFLMKMFNWGINLMLIVLCPPLGIALIADAASRGVDMGSFKLMDYAVEVVNRVVGSPLGSLLVLIIIVAITIATVLCPILIILTLPLLIAFIVDCAMGNATILREGFIAMGMDPQTAMIVSMVIGMIIGIILDIVLSIIIEVCTAGMGTELVVALWVAQATTMAAKIAMTVARMVVKIVTTVLELVAKLLSYFGKIGKILADVMMATIKMMIKIAAEIANLAMDAISMAKKLMRALEELTEMIADFVQKTVKTGAEKLSALLARGFEKTGMETAQDFAEHVAESLAKSMDNDAIETAARKADYKKANKLASEKDGINLRDDIKNHALNELDKVGGKDTVGRDTSSWMRNQEQYMEDLKELKGAYKELKIAREINEEQKIIDARKSFDDLVEKLEKDNPGLAKSARAHADAVEAQAAFDVAEAQMKNLKQTYKNLKEEGLDREHVYELLKAHKKVLQEAQELAAKRWFEVDQNRYVDVSGYLHRARMVIQNGFGSVQSLVMMQKNYLQAQLDQMKADINAYITMIDYMIKMLTDLMNRLMQGITEMGEDIANIGKQIKQIYSVNSQTMTNMSMA